MVCQKRLQGQFALCTLEGISHYSVVYAKYSIYDQFYMYDDRVHLENNPLSHFTDVPERISCFCCV